VGAKEGGGSDGTNGDDGGGWVNKGILPGRLFSRQRYPFFSSVTCGIADHRNKDGRYCDACHYCPGVPRVAATPSTVLILISLFAVLPVAWALRTGRVQPCAAAHPSERTSFLLRPERNTTAFLSCLAWRYFVWHPVHDFTVARFTRYMGAARNAYAYSRDAYERRGFALPLL